MDTNVKMVGFANQSINGVTVANEGFDMEYDGKKMNISGFSGDRLYYAKLNNKQLLDLLNMPASEVPLERRIMHYETPQPKSKSKSKTKSKRKSKTKTKRIKLVSRKTIRNSRKSPIIISKSPSSPIFDKYVSPKLRSEYMKSPIHSRRSSRYSRVSSSKKSRHSRKI